MEESSEHGDRDGDDGDGALGDAKDEEADAVGWVGVSTTLRSE